jgi:hypothetical protein
MQACETGQCGEAHVCQSVCLQFRQTIGKMSLRRRLSKPGRESLKGWEGWGSAPHSDLLDTAREPLSQKGPVCYRTSLPCRLLALLGAGGSPFLRLHGLHTVPAR